MAQYYFSILFYILLSTGCIISGEVSSSKSGNLSDYLCSGQRDYQDYSLRWRLERYDLLSYSVKKLKSPEFPPAGPDSRDWHIEFVPKQITGDSMDFLKLSFRSKSSKEIHSFIYLTISTDSGKIKEFKPNDNNLDQLLSVSALHSELDWNSNHTKSLIISTTIRVLSSTIHSCKNTLGRRTESKNWVEDISQFLLKDKTLQDFTITAQGKEFRVHKDVLAARSSAFSRMFSEDKEQGIIKDSMEINDFSPETVENIITFIYTDKLDDQVLKKFIGELLAAAERYDLKKLSAMCIGVMYENPTYLNVNNVLGALEAADKFALSDLKNSALEFIASHLGLLRETDKFKSLIAERPDLMVELSKILDGVRAGSENMDVIRTVVEFKENI